MCFLTGFIFLTQKLCPCVLLSVVAKQLADAQQIQYWMRFVSRLSKVISYSNCGRAVSFSWKMSGSSPGLIPCSCMLKHHWARYRTLSCLRCVCQSTSARECQIRCLSVTFFLYECVWGRLNEFFFLNYFFFFTNKHIFLHIVQWNPWYVTLA